MSIVNPVLSVVDVVVRQSEGNLQYKNHQTHNFLLSSSTSHDPNGNYLGWVGLAGWLVVGSNDAAAAATATTAAFTLSDGNSTRGSIIAVEAARPDLHFAPEELCWFAWYADKIMQTDNHSRHSMKKV